MTTILCTPVYRSEAVSCCPEMLATKEALKAAGLVRPEWLTCVGPEVRGNRNAITRAVLKMPVPWDALLWIDGDTSCDVRVVEKMIAADKPILGAGCKMRGRPEVFAARRGNRHVPSVFRGLMGVDWAGAGLMLVKREVYENLKAPWWRNLFLDADPWDQSPEDVGFCLYAKEHGYSTWLLGGDGVTHHDMDGDIQTTTGTDV